MPELWVRFDKDATDIMGARPVAHDDLNACMPADMRRPWPPTGSPWTPAATGLAMCRTLRRAPDARPQDVTEWPGMIAHGVEVLDPFEEVLTRGEARGARFQTLGSH